MSGRARWIMAALCVGIGMQALAPAAVADWPTSPVRWIVPVSPGGATDISARILQEPVSELLGQPIVVENRTGGAGVIATEAAVKADPDGYTLALIYTSHAANPALLKELPYDSIEDITPVAFFWRAPLAFSVHPDEPYQTLQDLIDAAKAAPGEIAIASGGVGTGAHLAAERFQRLVGFELLHAPYRGVGPAIPDVIAGRVPVLTSNASVPGVQVERGQLRALAVTGAQRSPLLPDVPTVMESGFDGYEAYEWIAVIGPAGMPQEATEKMNRAISEAASQPEPARRFKEMGLEHVPMSPDELRAFLVSEIDAMAKIIQEAGIKVE